LVGGKNFDGRGGKAEERYQNQEGGGKEEFAGHGNPLSETRDSRTSPVFDRRREVQELVESPCWGFRGSTEVP